MKKRKSSARIPSLASLLGGAKNADRFLDTAWPNEPFVMHGAPSRLIGLVDVPELKSAETMCGVPCRALLAQGQHLGGKQRFGNIAVEPSVAPSLLETGATLYFNEPEFRSRSLWKWIRSLERELGQQPGVIRPSAFFSAPGRGARMHFDCTESFVVQVRGRKTWTFARNEHVAFPPVNYLEGDPLPDELRELVRGPMKAPSAKKRVSVELKPGSVLYLPRGWWHSTHTTETSVHLDLLTALPTWADAARPLIESVLHRGEAWRAPVTTADPTKTDALLADVRAALSAR
ncbi:MAG: cupin-like domain-containing protein [Archangium sp.]|nr:cupin-like domain-containing protein [Archangium sp.]